MGKKLNILLEEIKQLMNYDKSLGGLILEQGSADIVDMRRSEQQLKNSNAPEKRKKENDIKYFNFGNIAKIPYVNGTQLFYLDNIDTGNILGITKKDKYGYYDEIFVDSYDNNVRRYYPTNDWDDWSFLKRNKIPYSFKTKDGQFFHLVLKLINPSKSVSDLDDSSNKSRGWALSYPGSKSALPNDSGTGYYRTDGGNQIPYNITAPIVPGDLSTYDLDTRNGFDKFMDSGFGVIAQIVVAIGVTILTRNLAISQMAAEGIVSTNVIRSRLFLASVLAESLQGIPLSIYYFNRPGYESAGWMSLAFIMLPVIQRYTPLNNILPDFNVQTCLNISKQIMESNLQTITQSDLKSFMSKLSMEEKTLFLEVLKKSDDISKIMKSSESKFLKQEFKSSDYLKYRDEIMSLINKPTESLFKTITKDFGITYTYAKLVEKIVEKYMNYQEKRGKNAKSMSKDFKKKIAENVKKIDNDIKLLPSMVQYFTKNKLPNIPTFELSDNAVVELCEKGIFSEEFKQKIYGGTAKYSTELLESSANEGASKNIKKITPEIFEEINKFILDPEYKRLVSSEKRKILEDVIRKQSEKYGTPTNSNFESDKIDKMVKNTEETPKTITTTTTPNEEIKYQWFDNLKNEWIETTKSQYNARIKKGNKVRELIFDKVTNQWIENDNTTKPQTTPIVSKN